MVSAGQVRQTDLAATEIGGPVEDPRKLSSDELRVPALSVLTLRSTTGRWHVSRSGANQGSMPSCSNGPAE